MQNKRNGKTLPMLIAVLAVLLILSVLALGWRLSHRNVAPSAEAPDNRIGQTTLAANEEDSSPQAQEPTAEMATAETVQSAVSSAVSAPESVGTGVSSASQKNAQNISLYHRHAGDGTPFSVGNMFPGDAETQYYCIRVSHQSAVTLRFRASVQSGYDKLAEVLRVRVTLPDSGAVLYDGLMRDMPESVNVAMAAGTDEVYYQISAYLDTSVGNSYMDLPLKADFNWWVEENDGEMLAPRTADLAQIALAAAAGVAACIVLVTVLVKRKKVHHG